MSGSDSGLPPGARLIQDFLPVEAGTALLAKVDAQPWLTDLSRRVQHYGWRYDYRARRVLDSMALGPLPDWLDTVCQKLTDLPEFNNRPDQVIVNEYVPGQGISAHVDCVPCFGPAIASLSLGAPVEMAFRHPSSGQTFKTLLPPLSLLVLTGEARHDWTHAIPARKSDTIAGYRVPRTRRVSLTFRTVLTE